MFGGMGGMGGGAAAGPGGGFRTFRTGAGARAAAATLQRAWYSHDMQSSENIDSNQRCCLAMFARWRLQMHNQGVRRVPGMVQQALAPLVVAAAAGSLAWREQALEAWMRT